MCWRPCPRRRPASRPAPSQACPPRRSGRPRVAVPVHRRDGRGRSCGTPPSSPARCRRRPRSCRGRRGASGRPTRCCRRRTRRVDAQSRRSGGSRRRSSGDFRRSRDSARRRLHSRRELEELLPQPTSSVTSRIMPSQYIGVPCSSRISTLSSLTQQPPCRWHRPILVVELPGRGRGGPAHHPFTVVRMHHVHPAGPAGGPAEHPEEALDAGITSIIGSSIPMPSM